MGLGNGNPKSGDKGSNFNYELKVLQGLEAIANILDGGGSGDPALNPGPAFSSGVLNCEDIVVISDALAAVKNTWCTYQKVGNIITTDIVTRIIGITDANGTITITLPVQVVGNVSSSAEFLTGTMSVSDDIGSFLDAYAVAGSDVSAVTFSYLLVPSVTETIFRFHISYVYNTSIATIDTAPIIL
jgi:hypothetical protein